jgi:YgiT-type zinc finger domain-containing protein
VSQPQITAPKLGWIQSRVMDGKYSISEHIIRFLTSRKLNIFEVEASLRSGAIVEYRRNPKNVQGSLVRGRIGNKTISVLCIQSEADHMIILLAYLEPAPNWEQDQEKTIHPKRGDFMEDKKRSCFFCGGDIKPIVVGNFDYRLEGDLFVVKNVPAGLCLECGEKYISGDAAKKINIRVESGEFAGTDSVRVIDFDVM